MNSIEKEDQLTARYNNYLRNIFSWAVFRNKGAPKDRKELNLDQMHKLCDLVGNPHQKFKVIHIAGTNGKGSVSIKTATALQKMGFKVGLFTSPHISTFRERIQVNGELVSQQNLVDHCERVFKIVDQNELDVRFFEIVTILGFLEFERAQCDYVVLECGLGGKLDATNVVSYPNVVVSAITSIGLDHMDVIGNSIEDIASEKSGIIKAGVRAVFGPTCKGLKPIEMALVSAEEADKAVFIDTQDSYCEDNNAVATQILSTVAQLEDKDFSEDLQKLVNQTSQPCRFEKVKNRPENIIMDVCHNIDGFKAVLNAVRVVFPQVEQIKMVFGISKSKKLNDIVKLIDQDDMVKDIFIVSRTHMRLYKAEDAHKIVNSFGTTKLRDLIVDEPKQETVVTRSDDTQSDSVSQISQGDFVQNITKTLDFILENGQMENPKSLLLICGSFFIMSDIKQYFGYDLVVDTI